MLIYSIGLYKNCRSKFMFVLIPLLFIAFSCGKEDMIGGGVEQHFDRSSFFFVDPSLANAYGMTPTQDKGFVLLAGKSSTELTLLKYDMQCNEILREHYPNRDNSRLIRGEVVVEDRNNTLVVGGCHRNSSNQLGAYLAMINEQGEFRRDESYVDLGLQKIKSLLQTPDGNYMVVSESFNSPSGFDTDIAVSRIDRLGNESDRLRINNGVRESAVAVVEFGTDQFGRDEYAILSTASEAQAQKVILTRMNADWGLLSSVVIGSVEHSSQIDCEMIKTKDKGLLVLVEDYVLANNDFNIRAIKLDSTAAVEWSMVYGGNDFENPDGAVQVADGGYVIAGSQYKEVSDNSDILLIKLDEAGTQQWIKSYGGSRHELTKGLIELENGDLMVLGSSLGDSPSDSDVLLLKTDAEGVPK